MTFRRRDQNNRAAESEPDLVMQSYSDVTSLPPWEERENPSSCFRDWLREKAARDHSVIRIKGIAIAGLFIRVHQYHYEIRLGVGISVLILMLGQLSSLDVAGYSQDDG